MSKAVNINTLLDEVITESGLTQEEIAEKLNYDKSYLSQARKAGTEKLYHKLLTFRNELRKSKKSINTEADWRDEHIALLKDQNQFLRERINELQRKLDELTAIEKTLNEVRNDMGVMAALQKGYQEYWAEHYPPKNVKPENVIKEIHNRAFSSLEKIQKEGIQL
jgi:phage shock protein A